MCSVLFAVAALPWLQGFFAPTAVTDEGSPKLRAELALHADVSDVDGVETIAASYAKGVSVFDREHHLLAHAPAFDAEGSADELVALAAGDASIGVPVIALAATSGGRSESVTQLTLYRVANDGVLQPMFVGEVERHEGGTSRTGVITLIPGGLVHRDPHGSIGMWLYDAERGRYVELFTSRPNA